MFGNTKEQNVKTYGSPVKRRKLNNITDFQEQAQLDFDLNTNLTRKKSLIDCFHFIGAINRKDSYKIPMLRQKSMQQPTIKPFDFNDINQKNNFKNIIPQSFNFQNDISSSSSSQDQLPKDLKLIKRVTMINPAHMYMGPKLFRCNSGIEIQQEINQADQRKYGDNIYLQQINRLKRKTTAISKENNSRAANTNFKQNYNKKVYQQDLESNEEDYMQQRLLKDYQITSNLHAYVKNHQNYLCLNKLQRIFYYVKKINFSQEYTQDDIFQMLQLQIRLYNKDDQSNLLRFYQSWQEQDCVYLVFETASTSLQEKLQSGIKLRQNQIWSILMECCNALCWMNKINEYHLNIKPGNILKCRQKYKLSDPFINKDILSKALSMFKGQKYQQQKLKLAFSYVAPQIMQYKSFIQGLDFQKCDIYSLGLCILENITGISVNLLKRDLHYIKKNNQKYLKGYSLALRNLLVKMVSSDPKKRPTPQQIQSINQFPFSNYKLKNSLDDDLSLPAKTKRRMSL